MSQLIVAALEAFDLNSEQLPEGGSMELTYRKKLLGGISAQGDIWVRALAFRVLHSSICKCKRKAKAWLLPLAHFSLF
jgi:hypothetical protein